MFMLHIEARAPNYDNWKKQFDSDPIGREKMGARRYQILRLVEDPNQFVVDVEFETEREARAALEKLRPFWDRVGPGVISKPQTRILEVTETKELRPAGTHMKK